MIEIQQEIGRTMRSMRRSVERQVKFATKLAIKDVAFMSKKALEREAEAAFDRPKKTTIKAGYVNPPRGWRSGEIKAEVFLKNFLPKGTPPNRYLAANIRGGYRDDKRSEVLLHKLIMNFRGDSQAVLPRGYQTFIHSDYQDRHGNIRGALMIKILSDLRAFNDAGYSMNRLTPRQAAMRQGRAQGKKARYFVIPVGKARHPGIYERKGGKLKMVIGFIRKPTYESESYDFYGVVRKTVRNNYDDAFNRRFAAALATMRVR